MAPGPEEEDIPTVQNADNPAGECAPLPLRNAEVLAPMVRACTSPLRWEALRYGADLVWGEEIIDRKIIGAQRVENPDFGTIDYVSPREQVTVFSTKPFERNKVIFQIGTADGQLASQAALTIQKDVRGVDVNMGCPKSFSVKGGMGAALLEKPEVASDILKTLRRNLPSTSSVTCKIRMLATTEKTREFMRICEASGAEAITVHVRLRDERPAEPAHWQEIAKLWDAVKVPVLANGDFFTRRQIDEFWKTMRTSIPQDSEEILNPSNSLWRGPSGIMIARGALWNPSIFCKTSEPPGFEDVVRKYTEAAVSANCSYQNTKWVLSQMLAGGIGVTPPSSFGGVQMKLFNRQTSATKSMAGICGMVKLDFEASKWPKGAHTTGYYKVGAGAALLPKVATDEEAKSAPMAEAQTETGSGKRENEAEDGGPAKRTRLSAPDEPIET
mmetsp:Transcript_43225/g.92466  ORF Transcript_43225/g.92466 Transcript_43225/m.92466 type:complete len:443 (-) Transcript_43225:43-1371(-)